MQESLLAEDTARESVVCLETVGGGSWRRRASRRQRQLSVAGILLGYLALGIAAHWPLLPGSSGRLYSESGTGDPAQTAWFLAWVAHALTHGLNPFFSAAINAPQGVNLAQGTLMPLLGAVTLPITLLVGPAASANLLIIMAMPVSAAAAFLVLRHWKLTLPAAALGGLLYGFSPFMLVHDAVHLQLAFVPLPPLIVAVAVDLTKTVHHVWRKGVLLGVLVAAQYLISSEILVITALLCLAGGLVVAGWGLVTHKHWLRDGTSALGVGLLTAAVVAGPLLAYPLWFQFSGPLHYSGPPWPTTNPYYADLLDFVAPSKLQAITPLLRGTGARLTLSITLEDAAYFGVPVLAVLAWLFWRTRRDVRVWLMAILAVVAAVLSLGPRLVVNGHPTGFRLPFDVLIHLPVLQDVVPGRFSFATDAAVAALVAFAVEHLLREQRRRPLLRNVAVKTRRRLRVGLMVAVVAIVVTTLIPRWPYPSTGGGDLPRDVSRAIPRGDPVVLTYPYPVYPNIRAMLWQADDNMKFRLLGGYAPMTAPDGSHTPIPPLLYPQQFQEYLVNVDLATNSPYPSPNSVTEIQLVNAARLFLELHHVDAVVVDLSEQHARQVVPLITGATGLPPLLRSGFAVWSLASSSGRFSATPAGELTRR